jgi:hypothetical protein
MTWLTWTVFNNVPPFHPNVVVIRFRSAVPNPGSSSSRSLLFDYGLPAFGNLKMLHNLAWLASHDLYVAQTWQVRQILRIWTKKEVAAISVVKAPKMPQFSPPWLISKVLAKTPLLAAPATFCGLEGTKITANASQYSRCGRINIHLEQPELVLLTHLGIIIVCYITDVRCSALSSQLVAV